ncbi:hypothetical protein BT69DRAFT_284741 [Atractiella rhizophila]|nr:hypothetical protein BT69DRAFT_284741 [Atractiella rhizophila]
MWNPGPDTDGMRQSDDHGARPSTTLLAPKLGTTPNLAKGGAEDVLLLNSHSPGDSVDFDEKVPSHAHSYSNSSYPTDSPGHSRTPTATGPPIPPTASCVLLSSRPFRSVLVTINYGPILMNHPPTSQSSHGPLPDQRHSHNPTSASMSALEEIQRAEAQEARGMERQRSSTSQGMNSPGLYNETSNRRESMSSLNGAIAPSNSSHYTQNQFVPAMMPRSNRSPPPSQGGNLAEFGVPMSRPNPSTSSHKSSTSQSKPKPTFEFDSSPSGSTSTKATSLHPSNSNDGRLKPVPPLITTDLSPSHRMPGIRSASEGTALSQFDHELSPEEEQKFWRSPDTIERKIFPARRQRTEIMGVEITDKRLKDFEMGKLSKHLTTSPSGTLASLVEEDKPVLGVVNLTEEDKVRRGTIDTLRSVDEEKAGPSRKQTSDTIMKVVDELRRHDSQRTSAHSQSTNRTDETDRLQKKERPFSGQSLGDEEWLGGLIT